MIFNVYKTIEEVGESKWDTMVSKRFFLSYRYLKTLELACPQLSYRYVLVYDNSAFVGLFYFQIIPFSGEALRNYLPTSNSIFKGLYDYTLAKVRTDLLVLGNVIFTCENGVLISDKYKSSAEELMSDTIAKVKESMDSKPLGTMISESIKTVSNTLFCPKKFHPFHVEDRMELNLEGMNSFDDYLNKMQSKYRLRVRKVLDLNLDTCFLDIDKENFYAYRSQIETLFLNVLTNSKFKLTTISVDYFHQFLKSVDRFKMKGIFIGDKMVGFVSYFQLDSIVEVHYVGLDYHFNHTHKIYNYILVKMIQVAYQESVGKVCFGRTAQELKSTLGARPFSTLSSLKINNSFLNIFTPIFLGAMVPELWTPRSPFKL
jgi:hypothetical protein